MGKKFSGQTIFGIFALAVAGSSIYALPYMKYLYYDDMLAAFSMNNQQSGFLLSMYAIGCMILYIPGGILADRFSTKKMMIISLLGTCGLGIILAFTLNYHVALVVWFLFAFSTGFVFWTALMKALRLLGTRENQGATYGWYYALNALVGIAANAVYLFLYNKQSNSRDAMFFVILGMSAFLFISAIFIMLYREPKTNDQSGEEPEDKFKFRDVPLAFKNINIWAVSLIMFMMYATYSCASYFTPYFTAHIGIEPSESAFINFIRGYVLQLLAPVGGYIADKLFKSTLKFYCIGFIALTVLFASVLFIPASSAGLTPAIVISFITSIMLYLMYGIMWSTISEVGIPKRYAATAIGIASLAAYMPDLFLYTIFGNVLDNYGDKTGYQVIFITLSAFSVIALVLSVLMRRRVTKAALLSTPSAA